jgi:signal peptidase I
VVEVAGGRVVIDGVTAPVKDVDGRLVEEMGGKEHLLSSDSGGGPDFGPTKVPSSDYLVLGDNRGNSADGRYFGWVERRAILGKAVAVCLHGGKPTWRPL